MLAWLWTRLSDGGPQVTISGRALRRFPEREVDRLLRARALIEHPRADSWSVCTHCDCGLDVRPIRQIGDELRACCPLDAVEDVVLQDGDVSRFGIDPGRLAGQIAASGKLSGAVASIADGIWSIGTTPSATAVILCRAAHLLEAPGTILAVKAAVGSGTAILIAHELGASIALRLAEAGLSTAALAEVLVSRSAGSDWLDTQRLESAAGIPGTVEGSDPIPSARLVISRGRRTLSLDGRDIVLSMTGFDAFLGAAEKVVSGKVMLTYQEMYALTNRASHRDVMNELRDQFERQGLPRDQAFDLVKTVHGRGMTIGLARSEIEIRD